MEHVLIYLIGLLLNVSTLNAHQRYNVAVAITPACASDDVTEHYCHWDAAHRGNRNGLDYADLGSVVITGASHGPADKVNRWRTIPNSPQTQATSTGLTYSQDATLDPSQIEDRETSI